MIFRLLTIIFVLLIVTGCATEQISQSREDYILANNHGWLEVKVADSDIPKVLRATQAAIEFAVECALSQSKLFEDNNNTSHRYRW